MSSDYGRPGLGGKSNDNMHECVQEKQGYQHAMTSCGRVGPITRLAHSPCTLLPVRGALAVLLTNSTLHVTLYHTAQHFRNHSAHSHVVPVQQLCGLHVVNKFARAGALPHRKQDSLADIPAHGAARTPQDALRRIGWRVGGLHDASCCMNHWNALHRPLLAPTTLYVQRLSLSLSLSLSRRPSPFQPLRRRHFVV